MKYIFMGKWFLVSRFMGITMFAICFAAISCIKSREPASKPLLSNLVQSESQNKKLTQHNRKTQIQEMDSEYRSDERRDLFQTVIDDGILNEYFHLKQCPSRRPLYIVWSNSVKPVIGLQKFNEPVINSTLADIGSRPFLEVYQVDMDNDHGFVKISYPPEGIRASFKLVLRSGIWQVEERHITEQK